MVAKGCDSRNIVTHVIENKIARDQLYIIGVPCTGMIDRRMINAMVADVTEVTEQDDTIIVKSPAGEQATPKASCCKKLHHLRASQPGHPR